MFWIHRLQFQLILYPSIIIELFVALLYMALMYSMVVVAVVVQRQSGRGKSEHDISPVDCV
jgi:hypothetical protein